MEMGCLELRKSHSVSPYPPRVDVSSPLVPPSQTKPKTFFGNGQSFKYGNKNVEAFKLSQALLETPHSWREVENLDVCDDNLPGRHTLLTGPPRSGKTSLLFQYAYSVCMADPEAIVVFIGKQIKLEEDPPCLPKGADISNEAYSRILMHYCHGDSDIKRLCAGLPLLDYVPALIIVDDFMDFMPGYDGPPRSRETCMAKTLALLCETVEFASTLLRTSCECELLVSDVNTADVPRLLYVYQRWLPQILRITGERPSHHSLSVYQAPGSDRDHHVSLVYSLAHRTFMLQQVVVDDDSATRKRRMEERN